MPDAKLESVGLPREAAPLTDEIASCRLASKNVKMQCRIGTPRMHEIGS